MQGSIFAPMTQPAVHHRAKVEFKAGRMMMEGSRVKPDPRKGKVSIIDQADGLTHFQWTDLATGTVVDDFIVFAGDAKFIKAIQAKGRVYLLEFGGSTAFFWMQEPDAEKDEERCSQLNEAINSSGPQESPSLPPTTGKTGKKEKPKQKVYSANTNDELAAILRNFARARPREEFPSLDEILTLETLDEVANDPQHSASLAQHLPDGQTEAEYLSPNLHSPQFHQALQTLSHVLEEDARGSVAANLGYRVAQQGNEDREG
mmetsp:Transcript_32058/g.55304  ORF Transcript_32058/g.55304 Transcript_32058/m.55304 type:complete len:260 (+) Transcript_32058:1284-2063(+)|eukprot:CAMPEP_0204897628 /NCGR_PEP_ID=MMETSP1397-20131031/846_1 /ASSEMBLY_ACC=CAM_ASM_000891 /TAXON_ID=49980 /ORGANISM="Climacostomum Climacostomum virens, Strain Stock W-24" /LENGTH=259 /DNA_ID=CAMNT_0052065405 /DNA_START=972 /DNA_END=1751 /DNA_ORIENTATION=+